MKTPRFSIFLVFFLIVGLLALLCVFDLSTPSVFGSQDVIQMDQTNDSPPMTNSFEKIETQGEFSLTYGWPDFKGKTHSVTFSLSKKQLSDAVEEFGYNPEEFTRYLDESLERMKNEMISHLTKFTSQQVLMSKYSLYISTNKASPKDFSLKLSAPPSVSEEAKAEFDRILSEITREQEAYLKRIEKEQEKKRKEYLEKRGFRFTGNKMGVNYRLVVQNNRIRVKQAVEAMRKKFGRKSLHQFMALMLAFIQKIWYGIPPLREKDKVILEFWVPPKVLVNNFGDCDSKGVAFASMWTTFKKYPLILIKIPKHLFVGVAIPSIGGEGFAINGIRYTLCEVTGPDLIPPGLITQYSHFYLQSGKFRYELIQ
jgi:hypothetical protein